MVHNEEAASCADRNTNRGASRERHFVVYFFFFTFLFLGSGLRMRIETIGVVVVVRCSRVARKREKREKVYISEIGWLTHDNG